MSEHIKTLEHSDCQLIADEFGKQGWDKPQDQYLAYLHEQDAGQRSVLVYWIGLDFAGYLTIKWESYYSYFRENNIPEIMDLNVLEKFQRRGVATRLMDEAEKLVFRNYPTIGISVGLTKNYGKAQRLYCQRGYVPDGNGITYNDILVPYRSMVQADDDLVLALVKERDRPAASSTAGAEFPRDGFSN
jgi:GNAT superfamily N-acetyltransferase